MLRRLAVAVALAALLSPTLIPVAPAQAADFNPHFIISDNEMRDYDSMDYGDILLFLTRRGGLQLARAVDPADGRLKDAAGLIADAAERYRVNPKYLLALIQKESSAVETAKPTTRQLDWATGYGVCDSCALTDPATVKYRGFGKQVTEAADWMDWYLGLDGALALVKPGETRTVDATQVRPVNLATAALYAYTPHVHGNRLLWSIWNRWFGPGAASFNYPDGTLLRNSRTGGVAVMQGGKLRPVASRTVLLSRYDPAGIVDLNEYDFAALMDALRGPAVKFPDLSLVHLPDGRIYLLLGQQKRHVASMAAFRKIGFNMEEAIEGTADDLADYAEGLPLTEASAPPSGELVRERIGGALWYVEAGVKRRFLDETTALADFPTRPVRLARAGDLEKLADGAPMGLRDGLLAKAAGSPVVYVIAGGERRPVTDGASFLAFGYKWSRVITVSDATLALHGEGQPLSFAVAGGI